MQILIAAATKNEISPLLESLNANRIEENLYAASLSSYNIDFLVTGIGPIAMSVKLTSYLAHHKPDIAINAGICGSYSPDLINGSLVQVTKDVFADLFFSNRDNPALNQGAWVDQCPASSWMQASVVVSVDMVSPVNAITVSRASSSINEATERANAFEAQIESMEGAAFHYAAIMAGVQHIQLRSVSNRAGDSTMEQWNVNLAVDSLSGLIFRLLNAGLI